MSTYHVRWPVVAVEALATPVLCGLLLGAVIRPVPLGVLVGLILAGLVSSIMLRRVRRRTLTVTDEGLQVQRDKYGLQVAWGSVTGVRHRSFHGLLPMDELLLTDVTLIARTSRGRTLPVPARMASDTSRTRIQISIYDKDWRGGAIGTQLRQHGIDTATAPAGPARL